MLSTWRFPPVYFAHVISSTNTPSHLAPAGSPILLPSPTVNNQLYPRHFSAGPLQLPEVLHSFLSPCFCSLSYPLSLLHYLNSHIKSDDLHNHLKAIYFLKICLIIPCCAGLSRSSCPTLRPHGLQPARLLSPWGFSRQEGWRGLPRPPPGDLPNPEIETQVSSITGEFFTFIKSYENQTILEFC